MECALSRLTKMSTPITSPRLVALQTALLAGDTDALGRFWVQVQSEGAPLLESVPDDDRHLLVTFLWRADASTNSVAVIRDWGGTNRLADQLHMQRLLDTNLWFASRPLKRDTRMLYQLSLNDPRVPWSIPQDRAASPGGWQLDPLNPNKHLVIQQDDEHGSHDLYFSRLELPDAATQPYVAHRSGVAAGTVECHRFASVILGNERRVWTYTPPMYNPAEAYPLLVVFDGKDYIDLIPTPTILNNLVAEGRIPPLVAIFLDSLGWEMRGKELTCYPPLLDFLTQELLPWVQQRFRLTPDPARTVVAGTSLGGLAAAYVGLNLSERFGNVLSQTGWFEWAPLGDTEQEWLARQFAARPRLPLQFYMDVGSLESEPPEDGNPSHLVANRHMRNVLRAKGYPVHYAEYSGGHDTFNSQGTLSDGLVALLGTLP